jgi:hypothetical protein
LLTSITFVVADFFYTDSLFHTFEDVFEMFNRDREVVEELISIGCVLTTLTNGLIELLSAIKPF